MNFESFNKIKAEFERLPKVKFYSFAEDSVILEHKENGALYQIPVTKEEDASYTLHLEKGVQVKEAIPTMEEEFKQNTLKFKESVKKIFSSYDEGVKEVREAFANFKEVDRAQFKKAEAVVKKDFTEAYIERYTKSTVAPVSKLTSKFSKQLKEHFEDEKAFIQLFHIFNEDNTLKTHDFNFNQLKSMYSEAYKLYNDFESKLKKMVSFHEAVKNIVISEEVADNIIKNMDFTKKMKVVIPKAIITSQRTINEGADLNVLEVSKKILTAYEETFGDANEVIYNMSYNNSSSEATPKFLKFNTGKYTIKDLEELEQELSSAMYVLPDLTQEDLMMIGNMKNECTYMNRTNIISDKKIDEIIKDFNSKFGSNGNEEFNDGEASLGFKDFDEMRNGTSDGFAVDDEDSKIDLEDTVEPEDEEDFEPVEGGTI